MSLYVILAFVVSINSIMSLGAAPKVVIIGGGIHSASCAYYLSLKGIPSIVIERSSVASAASGKSGGFLAKNWGSGVTRPLHEVSFELHKELAQTLNIQSFRQVKALSVQGRTKPGSNVATWLDRKVSSQLMDADCGQVTPKELTEKLLAAAIATGLSELMIGTVQNVIVDNQKVIGVDVVGHDVISTNKIIVCMGPWSGVAVEDWFGLSVPLTGFFNY